MPAEDDVGRGLHDRIQFLVLSCEVVVRLLQIEGFLLQFTGPLADSALQFAIQSHQLPLLAMQFSKNLDLGSQHLGNDGHGKVIYRTVLVAFKAIYIRQMDG